MKNKKSKNRNEKIKVSEKFFFIRIDEDPFGCNWYFLVIAENIEEAKEKSHEKYFENYLAYFDRVRESSINPDVTEIELDVNGVSKPIEIPNDHPEPPIDFPDHPELLFT